MSDISMIERVAMAIHAGAVPTFPWADTTNEWKQARRLDARSAIAAMREPTDEMLDYAYHHQWEAITASETYPHARGIWRAMIDAASPVHPQGS